MEEVAIVGGRERGWVYIKLCMVGGIFFGGGGNKFGDFCVCIGWVISYDRIS